MRIVLFGSLALMLSGTGLALIATPAQAQKYRVACAAPGAPNCRTSCGSNTHTVVCYATVQNGRCVKYCGRPR